MLIRIALVSVLLFLAIFAITGAVSESDSESEIFDKSLERNAAGTPRLLFTIKAITAFLLAPLVILALPIILLLALPVPVITIPGGRKRSFQEGLTRSAKQMWGSESCIERVACEMASAVRKLNLDFLNVNFLQRFSDKQANTNSWLDRVSRAAEKEECASSFSCDPIGSLRTGLME